MESSNSTVSLYSVQCTVYNVNMLILNLLNTLTGIKLSINVTLFCLKQYMDTKLALPQTSNKIISKYLVF